MTAYVFSFLAGVGVGILVLPIYIRIKYRHEFNKVKRAIDAVKKANYEAPTSVTSKTQAKEGMQKLIEITDEQSKILSSLEEPSKNSLHSKYKNQLAGKMHDLQEKKVDVIRDILSTGYDPKVMVSSENGEVESINLSEYLERIISSLPNPPTTNTETKDSKRGKFYVIKGGKTSH